MLIVAALGGNALLERGEKPDAAIHHRHIRRAAAALAALTREHQVFIAHGNGPQGGFLGIEGDAVLGAATLAPVVRAEYCYDVYGTGDVVLTTRVVPLQE